ncbi:MAG: hypothetical protein HY902_14840 [Deltaproteobacteria bacterium]|nr:hypothetical protein [Deltaproteobacteria bacterium]
MDECVIDPERCASSDSGWTTYSDCAAKDPLQVELGQGDAAFAPVPAGSLPTEHQATGAQGGGTSHIFGGVRIANPDPQRRKFRVEFTACSGDKSLTQFGYPTADDCAGVLTTRIAVLESSLAQASDGSLSRGGIQVFLQGPLRWVRLEVRDPCGRSAKDQRP